MVASEKDEIAAVGHLLLDKGEYWRMHESAELADAWQAFVEIARELEDAKQNLLDVLRRCRL